MSSECPYGELGTGDWVVRAFVPPRCLALDWTFSFQQRCARLVGILACPFHILYLDRHAVVPGVSRLLNVLTSIPIKNADLETVVSSNLSIAEMFLGNILFGDRECEYLTKFSYRYEVVASQY